MPIGPALQRQMLRGDSDIAEARGHIRAAFLDALFAEARFPALGRPGTRFVAGPFETETEALAALAERPDTLADHVAGVVPLPPLKTVQEWNGTTRYLAEAFPLAARTRAAG